MLRIKKLIIVMLIFVSCPVLAGETFVLIGPAVAKLQNNDNHLYGSVELRHMYYSWGRLSLGTGGVVESSNLENFLGFNLSLHYTFSKLWSVSLSSGPGRYSNDHFNLGNQLEFRSGLEIFYRFAKRCMLGFGVFHYSNSGIGGTHNPGTESIRLALVISL